MKLKVLHFADVAEIQEAVADELKRVQKEEFLATLPKMCDHAKACIYGNGAYFERTKKKGHVSSVFKIISPKTLELRCLVTERERESTL